MATGTVVESSLPKTIDVVDDDVLEVVDPPLDDEPEPPVDPAEARRIAEIEAKARRGGWRPLAEWAGDPSQWRDAEAFVRRGEEIAAIAQRSLKGAEARADRLEQDVQQLKTTVESLNTTLEQERQRTLRAEQAGYDRALAELKAKRKEAAATGDMASYAEYDDQIDQIEEQRAVARAEPAPRAPAPAPRPQPAVDVDPAVQSFVDANPWFMRDAVLNAAMIAEHKELLESRPGISLADNFETAKERVMARFPEKFGLEAEPQPPAARARRPAPSAPGGGGNQPRRATGIDTIQDPAERAQARRAFERAKAQIPGITEAEWFAVYSDPKADVIEIERQATARRQQRRTA
jgi:hypothetical protein